MCRAVIKRRDTERLPNMSDRETAVDSNVRWEREKNPEHSTYDKISLYFIVI